MVVDDDVGPDEFINGLGGLGRNFVRVVEVGDNIKASFFSGVFFEESWKGGVVEDAVGESNGDTAAKTDKFKVVELA